MTTLNLEETERARLGLGITNDRRGDEILVGLDRAESERYISLMRMSPRHQDDSDDARYLEARHKRSMHFWTIALAAGDSCAIPRTPENAFDLGFKAWNAFAGIRQIDDFKAMIVQVPKEQRLAALNGWLAAFDDEAARLRRG